MSHRRSDGREGQSYSIAASSSSSSPGHLPTTYAARSRPAAKGGGGARRFEDFLDTSDNDVAEGDDPFLASIKNSKRRKSGRPEISSTTPAYGKDLELGDTASIQAGPSSFSSQRTVVSIDPAQSYPPSQQCSPADDALEAPIEGRSKPTRLAPPAPRRTGSGSNRRTSLNLKASRRSSNLRDGTLAHPHPSVPDKELYRHCADDMTPMLRMKHLASWTLDRAREKMASTALSSIPTTLTLKGRQAKLDEQSDGLWSSQERKVLERCRASVDKVMTFTLRDLGEQKMNLSWIAAASAAKLELSPQPRPNPLNEENLVLAEEYSALVAALRSESARWEQERRSIEAYEEATAALLGSTTSDASQRAIAGALSHDVTAPPAAGVGELQWSKDDLGIGAYAMLRDAQKALAREQSWSTSSSAEGEAEGEAEGMLQAAMRAAAHAHRASMQGNGRASKRESDTAAAEWELSKIKGSDKDERWSTFEFTTDLLLSQTHRLDRLRLLSSSYTGSISSRAAQALRQMAFASDNAGESTTSSQLGSSALTGQGPGSSALQHISRGRRERLLRGIRESIGPVRQQEVEDENLKQGMDEAEDVTGRTMADQSAADLFRAFASSRAAPPSIPAKKEALAADSKKNSGRRSRR